MAVIVAGGAGFIGSHLVDRLAADGDVLVFDNMFTGRLANLESALKTERAALAYVDVGRAEEIDDVVRRAAAGPITAVYHLASSAGMTERTNRPWTSLAAHGSGTMNLLRLAERLSARFIFVSTSERALGREATASEAEGKRFGEALTAAAATELGIDGRIVRLSETYGPRMPLGDGSLVSTLLRASTSGERPAGLHDQGERRALIHVSDAIAGILAVAVAPPGTASLVDVDAADAAVGDVLAIFSRLPRLVPGPRVEPGPDLEREAPPTLVPREPAPASGLGWRPLVELDTGIESTCEWFRSAAKRYALV
jgi:nucleoside-diphosphate-sugar epimerase